MSSDPSESDKCLAFVTRAMPDAIDAFSIHEGGIRLWQSCWHADDPRCKMYPDEVGDVTRGVWRLTDGEVQRREATRRLDAIEIKLAELMSHLRALEQRRKPGRPRRRALEEQVA